MAIVLVLQSIHHTAVTLVRLDVYTPHSYFFGSSLSIHHKTVALVCLAVYSSQRRYVSLFFCLYTTQLLR